jgi:hypothetical protein
MNEQERLSSSPWREREPIPTDDKDTEEEPVQERTNEEMATVETKPETTETQNRSTSIREIGLDKPSPFNGDRKKVETFIQECRVYLQINKRIYTDDEAKVAFLLSLMKENEALRWKQMYLRSITNDDGDIVFPKIKDFVGLLLNYFQPVNQHQLAMLKQGKKTAEEIITEFRLLTSQAGYSSTTLTDNMHLIEKLQNVLNSSLVKKIMLLDNPPNTIEGWVQKAITIDGQYRATMDVLNRRLNEGKTSREGRTNKQTWSNYFDKEKARTERDPDAMDIDAMTPRRG